MDDDDGVVGFRFYPTEEELLCYYLPNKLNNDSTPQIDRVIPLVHIYDYSPWDLPQLSGEVCREDREQWFFFTEMQEREARGGRRNRLTEKGYWKASGSPSDVYTSPQNLRIGRKNTLVFYEGRAPNGTKTAWKMNEYKLYDQSANPQLKEELSLCRIYKGSMPTRAFEQRPQTEAAMHDQAVAQYYNHHHHHQHQRSDEAVITTKNPAVESEFINWDNMATETEPLMDSDILMLLNCFDL